MHPCDTIVHLAHAEARRIRAITDPEEVVELAECGKALPYFRVSKGQDGALRAEGFGHQTHDNAGRMPFVCDFLNRRVLPMVDAEADVRGCYRIELHDAYSYLPCKAPHCNALGFARPAGARESVALLPDPYHMGEFGGMLLRARDPVPWAAKEPVLFFAGTTTGDRDPAKNERVRACVWGLGQGRDVARMHITNVAQMSPDALTSAVPTIRAAMHPPVPLEEHFRYRYQVNIAGNTACWSRVPMIMGSRCLMLDLPQPDVMWYSPLIQDGTHYVGASHLDDLLSKRAFCEANAGWCEHLTENARRFVASFMEARHAALYVTHLLEAAATHTRC